MSARILVVEDNPDNLDLLRYLLEAHGYQALCATSGAEGVELASQHRPDLILMDIQMPGMDGFEATALIREQPELRRTPVVAVTAFAMVGDRERIMNSGFQACITKPVSPETVIGQIEAHIVGARRS